jgi:hypothetical protein
MGWSGAASTRVPLHVQIIPDTGACDKPGVVAQSPRP